MHRPVGSVGGRRLVLLTIVVAISALLLASCASDLPQSSLNPQSAEAQAIDTLWRLVLVLAIAVFVVVEAALVYATFRFRARKDTPEPKQTHGNTPLEIAWSIAPAIILAIIAVPTLIALFDIRSPAGPDAVVVNVTGHQWWWEFEYPGIVDAQGRPLTTANELHIPVGRTTELRMTSADVIHSFWVPPLAGKRDLVPGHETFIKITPDPSTVGQAIPGQCAEFCWLGHADMRTVVFVDTEADFAAWAASQIEPAAVPTEEPAVTGLEVFRAFCATCHQVVLGNADGSVEVLGEDAVGPGGFVLAPDLTHFGSRTSLGARVLENTPEHLAQWIDDPSEIKAMASELNDLETGLILGMPDYNLDAEQIAALVALLEGWK